VKAEAVRYWCTIQTAGTEIINLQAIMELPKGTEHFISDVHGEQEAFQLILNSCVVREKLEQLQSQITDLDKCTAQGLPLIR